MLHLFERDDTVEPVTSSSCARRRALRVSRRAEHLTSTVKPKCFSPTGQVPGGQHAHLPFVHLPRPARSADLRPAGFVCDVMLRASISRRWRRSLPSWAAGADRGALGCSARLPGVKAHRTTTSTSSTCARFRTIGMGIGGRTYLAAKPKRGPDAEGSLHWVVRDRVLAERGGLPRDDLYPRRDPRSC